MPVWASQKPSRRRLRLSQAWPEAGSKKLVATMKGSKVRQFVTCVGGFFVGAAQGLVPIDWYGGISAPSPSGYFKWQSWEIVGPPYTGWPSILNLRSVDIHSPTAPPNLFPMRSYEVRLCRSKMGSKAGSENPSGVWKLTGACRAS